MPHVWSQTTLNTLHPSPASGRFLPPLLSLSITYTASLTPPPAASSLVVAGLTLLRSQTRHVPSCDADTSECSLSGHLASDTTLFTCPRSVMTDVRACDSRGSTSTTFRDAVPAARSGLPEGPGRAQRDSRALDDGIVLTLVMVVRSIVCRSWSRPALYATVRSRGSNMAAVAGALWKGASSAGAAGAEALEVLQRPMQPSTDAVSTLLEAPSTSTDSMLDLCPYSSRVGFRSPEEWSSPSVYFHTRTVRSSPAEATCVEERNLAALMLELCPPWLPATDVAMTSPEPFHILRRPS
ncbi:hypothetical protein VP1G_11201 [Cytospora mali]|uniref:Uncharacterized protein n=1 Tax=Cytospora mali TaxID=578113 RepID=A0A194VAG9_CYTMA|nr:hypothetical protein VP1G_11201 [Valsa mali var. pyri (nom. inval.)]